MNHLKRIGIVWKQFVVMAVLASTVRSNCASLPVASQEINGYEVGRYTVEIRPFGGTDALGWTDSSSYEGGAYTASRVAATVARETAIAAATLGIGTAAQGGSTAAQTAYKGILATQTATGGYQIGTGASQIASGDYEAGTVNVVAGSLRVGGSIASAGAIAPKGTVSQIGDAVSARTPVGRQGQNTSFPNPNAPIPRNTSGTVNGRNYSGHAFDRMQERGLAPSVVEDTIRRGSQSLGRDGAKIFTTDQATVIVNPNGSVKTVW